MKQYDVVIFGATSFVGKLVVQHFLDIYGAKGNVSWAIAGRNEDKMSALRNSYGKSAAAVDIIIADADDLLSLKDMCNQTKVVITMAGPYALYGEKLVQACVETGTDYCDLTGEVAWVAEMISRFEDVAQKTGARIINFCGFDSIPSDMGVYYLQQESMRRFSLPCNNVKLRIKHAKGNAPGGTYATMMDSVTRARSSKTYRANLANPYLLCPANHGFKLQQNNAYYPEYDKDMKQWSTFWVMGSINTRVVHRSNALSDNSYSHLFRYEEGLLVGSSIAGRVAAYAVTSAFAGFFTLAAIPPTQYLLKKYVIPKPSEGSNLKALVGYGYDLRFIGRTANQDKLVVRVTGKGDPACFATSRMIAEAGVCIALDVSKSEKKGGFWTPSTVFGDKLISRLRQNAQMTFEVMVK